MLSPGKHYRYEDETEDPKFQFELQSTAPVWPGLRSRDLWPFLPMLITEIYQLTPCIGERYVNFHPRNMPGYIVKKIGILGIVTHKLITAKQITYMIDDGTARIRLVMKRDPGKTVASVPKKPEGELNIPRSRQRPGYPRPCPMSVHQIRQVLARTSDNAVQRYDYVVAYGYCTMEFERKKPVREMTKEDLKYNKIFLWGMHIRTIKQITYLHDMIKLIEVHVRNRLIDSTPQFVPKAMPKA